MRGWTEAAADALQDIPAHPSVAEAESSLLGAQRAGTRMRDLISDLLAHTTARDAPSHRPPSTWKNRHRHRRPTVVIRSTATADDRIKVTIADNGIGIPAGQHEAIFGNFHRAHTGSAYAGTGLGLSICQHIVHRHGGTITATDNPDGGSQFTFTLPGADISTDALPQRADVLIS